MSRETDTRGNENGRDIVNGKNVVVHVDRSLHGITTYAPQQSAPEAVWNQPVCDCNAVIGGSHLLTILTKITVSFTFHGGATAAAALLINT